jgi:four helix bundle protein
VKVVKNGFKDLIVWQKGYRLALLIYEATSLFPKAERYGLVSQMRSCSVSVPANISEGYERNSRRQYLYFLNIAKGSLGELETYLLIARDLTYINEKQWLKLEMLRKDVVRPLRGLIKSLS